MEQHAANTEGELLSSNSNAISLDVIVGVLGRFVLGTRERGKGEKGEK